MRIHTSEKPYKCDWPDCKWRFAVKGMINRINHDLLNDYLMISKFD